MRREGERGRGKGRRQGGEKRERDYNLSLCPYTECIHVHVKTAYRYMCVYMYM
jgi:hypothetical protein